MSFQMVNCIICNLHVNYTFLRADSPKCEKGHPLGKWVHCESPQEKHVYLRNELTQVCPYCKDGQSDPMQEGKRVKCLHVSPAGAACTTRPFSWIKEGPPCFMNHVEKMRLE